MGTLLNKNFKMANVIVETADADCMLVNLTLTGANEADTETFVAAGYTDGYTAEVELTWDPLYWASMTDGTNEIATSIIARTNSDNEVTPTANPNGAWLPG